jgi:alkylhydroperoxidase/carboxymuconolactone decarboxylase family protein YurZ
VIWVSMTTYSVIIDLSLCENVFCNEWSTEYVFTQTQITHYRIHCHTNSDHSLQNTLSHKLRSLITEYVVTQTQITHYRIRCHTNSDHSLQNTLSHKLRSLITEYVVTQTQTTHYRIRFHTNSAEFVWQRILLWVIWVCVTTYSVMSDLSLCDNVFCNGWSEFVWKRIL